MRIGLFFLFLPLLTSAAPGSFLSDLESFRANSLTLKPEIERETASSARAFSRAMAFTPGVNLAAGREESKLNGQETSNYGYWRASAVWNLFRSGGDFFAWRAAKLTEESQGYRVQDEKLQVELVGAHAIFEQLYFRDAVGAQRELLKLKEEAVRIATDRYKQGKSPLQDVAKLEVDLAQQRIRVRSAELEQFKNEMEIKSLFVDSLQTRDWPFLEGQQMSWESGSGALSTKRLAARAEAAKNSWRGVRTQHLPRVDLNFNYREYPLKTRSNDTWSGVLELTIPLWSRFETSAASAEAFAEYIASEDDGLLAARAESAKRDYLRRKVEIGQANVAEAKRNLEKANRLYEDMLRSFRLGRLSANDLFLEQDRKITNVLSYSQSRLAFHDGLMEACALWGLEARDCLH